MCLVDNNYDVAPVRVGLVRRNILVEFLNEREHVRLVLSKQTLQVPAVIGAHLFGLADDVATGIGSIDLIVEILAIGQHQKGKIASQLAVHLSAEKHHGIGFARTLCVPEDAQLAVDILPHLDRTDGTVHAQILLVLSDDFDQLLTAVIE